MILTTTHLEFGVCWQDTHSRNWSLKTGFWVCSAGAHCPLWAVEGDTFLETLFVCVSARGDSRVQQVCLQSLFGHLGTARLLFEICMFQVEITTNPPLHGLRCRNLQKRTDRHLVLPHGGGFVIYALGNRLTIGFWHSWLHTAHQQPLVGI